MTQDHLFAQILDSFAQLEKWIPGCGSWPVDLLIGRLPDANPADVYRLADAWGASATRMNSYYEEIAHLADPILTAWQGDGAPMQFQEVWTQHLQDVGSMIESLGSMQQVVQGYGLELEIEEFFIAFTLIQLLVEAIVAVIGAFFSGGLSLGGLGAAYAAARVGIKEAFEKCMQAILNLAKTLATGELRHIMGENTAKDLLRAGGRQLLEHLGPRNIMARAAADKAANQFRKDLVQSALRRELRKELAKVSTRAEARAAIRTLDRTAADLSARVAAELQERLLAKFTGKAATTTAVDLASRGDALVERFIQEQVARTTLLGTTATYVGKLALHGAAFMGGVDFLAQGFELVTGERGSIDMSEVAISLGQGGLMGGLMFGHGLIGSMSTGGLAGTVTAAATDAGKAIYGAATGQDMRIQWKDDLLKGARDGVRMGAVFAAPGVLGGLAARLAPHAPSLPGHEVFAFDDPRLGANVVTMNRGTGEVGFTTQHGGIGYRLGDGSFVRIDGDGTVLARHVGGDFVDAGGGPGGGTGVLDRPSIEPARPSADPRVPSPREPSPSESSPREPSPREPGRVDPGRSDAEPSGPGPDRSGAGSSGPDRVARGGVVEGEVVSSHVVEHPSAVDHPVVSDPPRDGGPPTVDHPRAVDGHPTEAPVDGRPADVPAGLHPVDGRSADISAGSHLVDGRSADVPAGSHLVDGRSADVPAGPHPVDGRPAEVRGGSGDLGRTTPTDPRGTGHNAPPDRHDPADLGRANGHDPTGGHAPTHDDPEEPGRGDEPVAPVRADRAAPASPDERPARPEIPPERAPVRTPHAVPRAGDARTHAEAVRASMQDRHAPPVLRAEQEAHLGRADTGQPAASLAQIERTVHDLSVAAREAAGGDVRPENPTRWADAAAPDTAPVDEFPARLFHDVLAARVPGGLAHADPRDVRETAHDLARQILATHEPDIRSVDTARRLREYVATELRTADEHLDRAATDRLADRAASEARATAARRTDPSHPDEPRAGKPHADVAHRDAARDGGPHGDAEPHSDAVRDGEPHGDAEPHSDAGHEGEPHSEAVRDGQPHGDAEPHSDSARTDGPHDGTSPVHPGAGGAAHDRIAHDNAARDNAAHDHTARDNAAHDHAAQDGRPDHAAPTHDPVPPAPAHPIPTTPPTHERFRFTRKFVEFNRDTREIELVTEHVERRWTEADYGRPPIDGGHDGPYARELAHRAAQDLADREYARIVDATDRWLDGSGDVREVGEIGGMSAAVVLPDGRVVAATSVRERTDRVVDARIPEREWSRLRTPERETRSAGYAARRKDLLADEERGIVGNTHPLVRDALADVAARLRSQTHGRCAEPAVLSRIARTVEADGGPGDLATRFRAALSGAHIASHRNDGTPMDRSEQFPCSTDDQLLRTFDLRSDYVDTAIGHAFVDPDRRLVILADARPGDDLRDFATHLPDLPPDHLTVVVHARVDGQGGIVVRLGDRDAGGVELARVVQRILDAHPDQLKPHKIVLVACEGSTPARVGRGTTTLAAQVAERLERPVVASPHVILVSEHGDVAFATRPTDGGPITRPIPRADAGARWTETTPTHDDAGTVTGSVTRDVPPGAHPFPDEVRPGRLAVAGRDPVPHADGHDPDAPLHPTAPRADGDGPEAALHPTDSRADGDGPEAALHPTDSRADGDGPEAALYPTDSRADGHDPDAALHPTDSRADGHDPDAPLRPTAPRAAPDPGAEPGNAAIPPADRSGGATPATEIGGGETGRPGTDLAVTSPHPAGPTHPATTVRPEAVPAVPGSRFHAVVRPEPAVAHITAQAEHVIRDLLETQPPDSPLRDRSVDIVTRPPDDPGWPGDAVARVVPVDARGHELPYGTRPPPGGGYRVEISDRAGDDSVPRAIAHAVAETTAIEGRLRDGRPAVVPDSLGRDVDPRPGAELSPRDVGRLVEHDLLTARANDPGLTPTARAVARDELDRLRAHLGLDGHDAAAVARRRLAGLTEPGDLNPGRRLPAPLGFRDTYTDAHYTPDATTYEQRIGEYYFGHPDVVEAARTAVRQLRHVLTELTAAARPDLAPAELRDAVDSAFVKDDPSSAGQVGPGVPLDELIEGGNLRELMTAVYNASYYHRDNPGTLGHRLIDVIDHDRWDVAERAGVDVDTLRRMRDQLDDNPLRPLLERVVGYQYARDIFGTGNVAAISDHPVRDSAELTASQRRRPRPEDDQLTMIHTVGDYARLGAPLGRFERAYLERKLGVTLTDDTPLPWREGHLLHIVSHNLWARAMDKRGLLPVDGVSGTTARMLTAAKLMGLDAPTLQLTVRGLMAWMLPGRDHSMFEILRGVEIAGLLPEAPRSERFDPTSMYRDVPGTPLATVRDEIAPAGLVPHETGYLRLAVDPAGFTETQHKVQDIADALWPQLRDGVVTDPRLAGWLRDNGYDPDVPASVRGIAVHLTRPHLMALTVYTRHSHYLINNVIRTKMWLRGDAVVRMRFNAKVDDLVHDYLGTLAAGRKPLPLALLLRMAVHTGDGHLTSESPLTPAAQRFVDAFRENRAWLAEAARLTGAGLDPSPAAGPAAVALARMVAAEKEVLAAVEPLRGPLLAEVRRHADMVYDALMHLPPVGRPDAPVIAFRGDWTTPVHSPIYGGRLSPHGQAREVLSMSRRLEVALRFMAENPAGGRKVMVVYRLTGHYARDLSVFSSFPDDRELVFPPGARLVRVDDPELARRVYDELPPAWQDACEIIVMDEE